MKKAKIPGYKLKYLFDRNGHFVYRRIIPKHLHNLSGNRTEFKESLRTNDPSIALVRYPEVHEYYDEIIDQMYDGVPYDPKTGPSVAQLKPLAKSMGLNYVPAGDLIKNDDTQELTRRFKAWDQAGRPSGPLFDAVFGSQPDPIKLSDALSFFEEHIRDELIKLEPRAKQKKLNPKRHAIQELINFLEFDADIRKITKKDALDYRGYLLDRIEAHEIKSSTANKQIGTHQAHNQCKF